MELVLIEKTIPNRTTLTSLQSEFALVMIQIGIKETISGIPRRSKLFLVKKKSCSPLFYSRGFLVKDKTTTKESENHVNTVHLLAM